MNSHCAGSASTRCARFTSPCWLVRQLPPWQMMALMLLGRWGSSGCCTLLVVRSRTEPLLRLLPIALSFVKPCTPSRALRLEPLSIASRNLYAGIRNGTGFSPAETRVRKPPPHATFMPLFVPGRPTCPSASASNIIMPLVISPLLRRCGPQPCITKIGRVVANCCASALISLSSTSVMRAAHAEVFATQSYPVPRR